MDYTRIAADMFHLGLPWIEKVLRPIIVYVFLILGLRLAGKRELAQLNPFDLVVLLTLSNTVQNAIIGHDETVTGGILGAATLLLVNYTVVRFLYAHTRLEQLAAGAPEELVTDGKMNRHNCRRQLMSRADLESAARRQGFTTLEQVETATLEPGGTMTFVGRTPSVDTMRHDQVMRQLNAITREIADMRKRRRNGDHPH